MSDVKLLSSDGYFLQDSNGRYLITSDVSYDWQPNKSIIVSFDNVVFSNEKIYQEEFSLYESICSQNELRFGGCESSELKMKIRNEFGSLIGKKLNIKIAVNGDEENPFQVGEYKVAKAELSGDKKYVNIVAYDTMFDIINTNVVGWYDALEFPMTMKQFRDSFFTHMGIEQETVELIQDSMIVEKTISADEITGSKVMKAVCELNGVFGKIGRDGKFEYLKLPKKTENNVKSISAYRKVEYEDYLTSNISKIHIRQFENDIGGSFGESDANVYAIEDNFLVYGKNTEQLNEISERLYDAVKDVSYIPSESTVQGSFDFSVGDYICLKTKYGDVETYILERTLKGIQALKDEFVAKGIKVYTTKGNSLQKEIRQLKGKTNVLERNVDETRETISDVETGLKAEIVKNTESISQTISETNQKLDDEVTALKNAQSSIQQRVDSFSVEFKQEISKVDGYGEDIEELKKTSYKFDTEDLTIEKSGSEIKTKINEDGMRVYKGDEEMLKANNEGVDAVNLHAKTYLIIGNNSRFEDYEGDRTACFWIGN